MAKIITFDGLDDAIVGVGHRGAQNPVLVYDRNLIIRNLMRDMSEEDAEDYFDYNILQLYAGEGTPIILFPLSPQESIEWAAQYNEEAPSEDSKQT